MLHHRQKKKIEDLDVKEKKMMKAPFYLYLQLGHFISRTAIEAEILFAVCLIKKQALTGGKSLARENKYSKKIGAESVVLHFVFFMIIINKMQQSAKTKLLLNSPTDMPFGNRWSRYKEPSKNKAEAYRVYVEHLFLRSDAGDARIFSKEMTHTDNQGDNGEQKAKQYYYHSDHLGSAQFVTDWKGRQYEHIEYTPYGELWIEEVAAGLDKLPFRFTGKELDEETGLYYYGARYLDPKYSRWLSGDPVLGEYIPKAPINDEAKKHNENLPGMGGIYNTVNLHVYHYAGNNPVKYTDPNGKSLDVVDNGNGTYTVCGGIENSDKNIYLIVNGQRTGDVIGVMFTEHSFFDGGKVVAGAVINPNDSSGQEYLDDFKDIGIGEMDNKHIYHHRGMPLGIDEIGLTYEKEND